MTDFDPRITPARPDLAAMSLKGQIKADRFVEGTPFQVRVAHTPIRKAPAVTAPLISEARYGERITIYEQKDGWGWGQLQTDGYVGFIAMTALTPVLTAPTHRVQTLSCPRHPDSDVKTPPLDFLPLLAKVTVTDIVNRFARLSDGTWCPEQHLVPLTAPLTAPPEQTGRIGLLCVAGRLLGVPYVWGGRTSLGIDCSGLVQLAAEACGLPCQRDSDQQAASFGQEISPDPAGFDRGDIVFFKGHVGIMGGGGQFLHANAHHMQVTSEPLADVFARGNLVTRARRV
jgi:cell wall-associated NlpC family hydrolase